MSQLVMRINSHDVFALLEAILAQIWPLAWTATPQLSMTKSADFEMRICLFVNIVMMLRVSCHFCHMFIYKTFETH